MNGRRLAYAMLSLYAATPLHAAQAEQPAISTARAKSLYILHCAGCHQMDGSGQPHAGIPTMRDTLGYFLLTPAGRALLVQVPGARNATVSDAELAALTNWQLAAFSPGSVPPGSPPYTEEEVSRLRGNPPQDVMAARRAVLQTLHEQQRLPPGMLGKLTKQK